MRYFIIAVLFIVAAVMADKMIVRNSPDRSVESGLRRIPTPEMKQSQEDRSIWDTQRYNNNQVPRD